MTVGKEQILLKISEEKDRLELLKLKKNLLKERFTYISTQKEYNKNAKEINSNDDMILECIKEILSLYREVPRDET